MNYSKEYILSLWNVYISNNPEGTKAEFLDRFVETHMAMEEGFKRSEERSKLFNLLKQPNIIK